MATFELQTFKFIVRLILLIVRIANAHTHIHNEVMFFKVEYKGTLISSNFTLGFFTYVTWRLLIVKELLPIVCVILMNVNNTHFYNIGCFINFKLFCLIIL